MTVAQRLQDLRDRLTKPTPAPLAGQQAIDVTIPAQTYEQPALDDDGPTQPSPRP